MKTLQVIIKDKVRGMKDNTIMSILNSKECKQSISDWRNWGNNHMRIFAEEAHKRGLIS